MYKLKRTKSINLRLLLMALFLLLHTKSIHAGNTSDFKHEVCKNTTTLQVSDNNAGIEGYWSCNNTFVDIAQLDSPNTIVSNLKPGINTFKWYSLDDKQLLETIEIVYSKVPDTEISLEDSLNCNIFLELNVTAPNYSTPAFSFISGSATIANITNSLIKLSNISYGKNTLVYTLENGKCKKSDTATIFHYYRNFNIAGDTIVCHPSLQLNFPQTTEEEFKWEIAGSNAKIEVSNDIYSFSELPKGKSTFVLRTSNQYCHWFDTLNVYNHTVEAETTKGFKTCKTEERISATVPKNANCKWECANTNIVIEDLHASTTNVKKLEYGVNTFYWIVSNEHCADTATLNITNKMLFVDVEVDNKNLCYDDCLSSVEIIVDKNMPKDAVIEWTNMQTEQTMATGTTVKNLCAGYYKFVVKTNNDVCPVSDVVRITTPDSIKIEVVTTLPDNCITKNGSIETDISGGSEVFTVEWTMQQKNGEMEVLPYVVQDLYAIPAAYYELVVTDSNECKAKKSINLMPPALNSNDFYIDNTDDIYINLPVDFTLNNQNYNVAWNITNGELIDFNAQKATAKWFSEGEQTILAKITDGCSTAEISKTVFVLPLEKSGTGYLFSPNNDGINDVFELIELRGCENCYHENELIIYNSMGRMVKRIKPYENNWRGRLDNGKMAADGLYFFYFRQRPDEKGIMGFIEIKDSQRR